MSKKINYSKLSTLATGNKIDNALDDKLEAVVNPYRNFYELTTADDCDALPIVSFFEGRINGDSKNRRNTANGQAAGKRQHKL